MFDTSETGIIQTGARDKCKREMETVEEPSRMPSYQHGCNEERVIEERVRGRVCERKAALPINSCFLIRCLPCLP